MKLQEYETKPEPQFKEVLFRKNLNIAGLRSTIEKNLPLHGGEVQIMLGQKIGLGLARVLVNLPATGIDINDDAGLKRLHPHHEAEIIKGWIQDGLIPKTLMEESPPDSGHYVRTKFAEQTARYDVYHNQEQ